MKKIIKLLILIVSLCLMINLYIVLSTKNRILTTKEISKKDDIDCILVLGAGIRNNKPSPMLEDRLSKGTELYNNNISPKILVSGDHTKKDYDEVNVMKNYLIENEIPSNIIFMDHAGISTYDSIYRAKKIFKANKIVIVTQKYHMYRAIYIAKSLGIDAYGIPTKKKSYYGDTKRNIRELIARIKDFFKCIYTPESKYLGEVYPISGNGDKTNNKEIYNRK